MFDRFIALIGREAFDLIRQKRILLLGVGGVGGYVAESLIRSGIRYLTIVDYDTIDETNLNRQILALHSTIGKPKVEVAKERLEDIDPYAHITIQKERIDESLSNLHLEEYDYVIDCIDDLKVKVALAKRALEENIKLVISTGTAKKMDPSKLTMTSLDKTSYDPLARRMRASLRGYKTDRLTVLASTEKPIETESECLGSTAFVPSSAGLLIASHVIRNIIK